jgi:tripartite-type tricarboxylate transporter receptor subunit TctC
LPALLPRAPAEIPKGCSPPGGDNARAALLSFVKSRLKPHHRGGRHAQVRCRHADARRVCPATAQSPAPDAKDYPNRAIHIVVPFPAGGPADVAARLLAQRMKRGLGPAGDRRQPARRQHGDRRAAGRQGRARRLHAADGDRLDAGDEPVPLQVAALVAKAKAAPGKLNYGAGTITAQLMGYRFHEAAGLDIVYVPFKGTPETVNGLLTGSVQAIYAANVTVKPLIEGGKVRALAKLDRLAPTSMAAIPTLAEASGLPNLEDMSVWLGLVAPKGTPAPIIGKIQQKVAQILSDPAMREKSERTGAFPIPSTPEQFGRFIREEADRWSRVLKETNIRYD